MKKLIVAADDFAQNEAVDDGILELIDAGRLTATSCLVASPRWPQAARRIERGIRMKADIGIHIDLTEFVRPAGGHAGLALASYSGWLTRRRLRALIDAQLQRFEDALAAVPDYIDGHRHVHQLPRVRDALLAAVLERYGARLPWVRISRATGWNAGVKARLVSALGARDMTARCKAFGIPCNERLLGFYAFDDVAAAHRARLHAWLAQTRASGDVLMCHPAARCENGDPIGRARAVEFEIMRSDAWPAMLAAEGVELTRGRVDSGTKQGV